MDLEGQAQSKWDIRREDSRYECYRVTMKRKVNRISFEDTSAKDLNGKKQWTVKMAQDMAPRILNIPSVKKRKS